MSFSPKKRKKKLPQHCDKRKLVWPHRGKGKVFAAAIDVTVPGSTDSPSTRLSLSEKCLSLSSLGFLFFCVPSFMKVVHLCFGGRIVCDRF